MKKKMIFSENISFGHQLSMDMDLAIIEEKESSGGQSKSQSKSKSKGGSSHHIGQSFSQSKGDHIKNLLLESNQNLMGGSMGESCFDDDKDSSDGCDAEMVDSECEEEESRNGMLSSNCSQELNLIIAGMDNEEGNLGEIKEEESQSGSNSKS